MKSKQVDRILATIDETLGAIDVGNQTSYEAACDVPLEGECVTCGSPTPEGSSWCAEHRVVDLPTEAEIEALAAVLGPALEAIGAMFAQVLATVADIIDRNPELLAWANTLGQRIEDVADTASELERIRPGSPVSAPARDLEVQVFEDGLMTISWGGTEVVSSCHLTRAELLFVLRNASDVPDAMVQAVAASPERLWRTR